jgi:very-short-patch-repair endonuclease
MRNRRIPTSFFKNCPHCGCIIYFCNKDSLYRSSKHNSICNSCSKLGDCNPSYGKTFAAGKRSDEFCDRLSLIKQNTTPFTREKMSGAAKKERIIRYANPEYHTKLSGCIKLAMHRPDIRKKHIEGLHNSKWLKVKTDRGQLELLSKWNDLGFKFEPNYQIHTDTDLFYIDGYDEEHNVVLEYDSKYHKRQQQKDLIRQNKIIDILKPKKFWRYDAVNKQCRNVLERVG